jgi:hypothetical protein
MFTGIVSNFGHVRHMDKRGDPIRKARSSGEGNS